MTPSDDRIPWEHLKANYAEWRKAGHWILADCEFGFNHFLSYVVGTERLLISMMEDPEWVRDMFLHSLDVNHGPARPGVGRGLYLRHVQHPRGHGLLV